MGSVRARERRRPRDARDLGHGPGFGPFGLLCEMICLCGLCAMCFRPSTRSPPPPPPPRQPQPVYGAAPAPEASPARARVRECRAAPRRSGPAAPARRRAAGRPAARLRAARRVAAAALRLSARPALCASYIAAAPEARGASVLGASSPRTCGASRRRAAEASRCLRPVSARLHALARTASSTLPDLESAAASSPSIDRAQPKDLTLSPAVSSRGRRPTSAHSSQHARHYIHRRGP